MSGCSDAAPGFLAGQFKEPVVMCLGCFIPGEAREKQCPQSLEMGNRFCQARLAL